MLSFKGFFAGSGTALACALLLALPGPAAAAPGDHTFAGAGQALNAEPFPRRD